MCPRNGAGGSLSSTAGSSGRSQGSNPRGMSRDRCSHGDNCTGSNSFGRSLCARQVSLRSKNREAGRAYRRGCARDKSLGGGKRKRRDDAARPGCCQNRGSNLFSRCHRYGMCNCCRLSSRQSIAHDLSSTLGRCRYGEGDHAEQHDCA